MQVGGRERAMDVKLCDREFQRSSREPSADLNDPEAKNCLDLDNDLSRLGESSNRSSVVPVWCQLASSPASPIFFNAREKKIGEARDEARCQPLLNTTPKV